MLIEISTVEMEKAKKLGIVFCKADNSISDAISSKYQEIIKETLDEMAEEVEAEELCGRFDLACEMEYEVISEVYGDDVYRVEQLEDLKSKIASILRNEKEENDEGGLE